MSLVVSPEEHAVYAQALETDWPSSVRRRFVVTKSPFRRGAWRRLAALCTPTRSLVAFLDADCVAIESTLLLRTQQALEAGGPRIVVFSPAWSRQPEAEAFLTLGELSALQVAAGRARGSWAGTVGLLRAHAVLVGWDDQLDGWGAEDHAFCQRALALGFQQETFQGDLVHVWHPAAGEGAHPSPRSLDSMRDNVKELRARVRLLPEERYQRALDEIYGLRGVLFRSLPEAMVHEVDMRWLAYEQAKEHGFPLLQHLDAARVPSEASWPVLAETEIHDS